MLKTHTEHPTDPDTTSQAPRSPWAGEQILLDRLPRQAQPGRTQSPGPWHPGQPSLFLKAHTGTAPCPFLGAELVGARRVPEEVGAQRGAREDRGRTREVWTAHPGPCTLDILLWSPLRGPFPGGAWAPSLSTPSTLSSWATRLLPAVHAQGGGSQRCPRWWQWQQAAAGSGRERGTPGHCLPVLALTLFPAQQGPGNYTDTFKLLILLKIIPRSGREAGPHALPGCNASLLPSAGTGQPRGCRHPSTQCLSPCLGQQHPSTHGMDTAMTCWHLLKV